LTPDPPKCRTPLERELIGLYLLLHTLFRERGHSSFRERSHSRTIEEDYTVSQNLVAKAPLPILPLPGMSSQPALHIGPPTFGEELIASLSKLAPGDNGEPLRLLPSFPIRGSIGSRSSETKGGYRISTGGKTHLRVGSKVSDDHKLVQTRHTTTLLSTILKFP